MIPAEVLDFVTNGVLDWPIWKIALATLLLTHITIASVTIFLHRCQAHRALDLHASIAHFFRVWLWLTTGMQTKEWAAIHRKHHAKCETAEDPHSPQTRGLKKVLFQGAELYMAESSNSETLQKYGHGTPDDWIENNVYSRFTWHGCGVMLVTDWVLFGLGVGTVVWTIQMMWIPFFAAGVINGIGHFYGYRNYDYPDASRNIVPWGILVGGEELHNNHHTFATSAKLSSKWYEFDIGWAYIRVLAYLRLATIKKVAPKPVFSAPRPNVDLENLHAVISNRYDVMAKYVKSGRRVIHEEIARLKSDRSGRAAAHGVVQMRRAKRSMFRHEEQLTSTEKAHVLAALAHSEALKKLHDMGIELARVWERSSATREQLLAQLEDWCKRAEESGVRALQEFSLRLRRYG
jgi:stearoyl-CoA desaturase (delta-9 desaturase)